MRGQGSPGEQSKTFFDFFVCCVKLCPFIFPYLALFPNLPNCWFAICFHLTLCVISGSKKRAAFCFLICRIPDLRFAFHLALCVHFSGRGQKKTPEIQKKMSRGSKKDPVRYKMFRGRGKDCSKQCIEFEKKIVLFFWASLRGWKKAGGRKKDMPRPKTRWTNRAVKTFRGRKKEQPFNFFFIVKPLKRFRVAFFSLWCLFLSLACGSFQFVFIAFNPLKRFSCGFLLIVCEESFLIFVVFCV